MPGFPARATAILTAFTTAAAADVITFDELGLPTGTVITNQYAPVGVLFSPVSGQLEIREATGPLFPGEPMGLAELPYWTSAIIADFPTGASSAGAWIDFGVAGPGVKIEAFDGPGATGTLLAIASTTSEDLLSVDAPNIASIRFSNVGTGFQETSYLIDNFTFTLIPAPAGGLEVLAMPLLSGRRRSR